MRIGFNKLWCLSLLVACQFAHFDSARAFHISNPWKTGRVVFSVDLPSQYPDDNVLPPGSSSMQDLQSAFVDAANEWTEATLAEIVVEQEVPLDQPCDSDANQVSFSDVNCEGFSLGSQALAVERGLILNGSRIQSKIIFNTRFKWEVFDGALADRTDFRRVALHELGHSLGFGHEDGGQDTIMQSRISDTIWSVQQDDLDGVALAYDEDQDFVGIANDNCSRIANTDQGDVDKDGLGDACDGDIDGDQVLDSAQPAPSFPEDLESLQSFSLFSFKGNSKLHQTVEVEATGQLESVTISVACDPPPLTQPDLFTEITVEIRSVTEQGVPTDEVLASDSFTGLIGRNEFGELPRFYPIDAGGRSLSFDKNDRFAITASSTQTCRWYVFSGFSYDNGSGFREFDNSLAELTSDFGFILFVKPVTNDNCPFTPNADQLDDDADGLGNACDNGADDIDKDETPNAADNCPLLANFSQSDVDQDGIGDACDPIFNDSDDDRVADFTDNCPMDRNTRQRDSDLDGIGDVCDPVFDDADSDSIADAVDNCPDVPNPLQVNSDNDSTGDACDADDDNDSVLDENDNCPVNSNTDQSDADLDGLGDVCDSEFNDQDDDLVPDAIDNCPASFNPMQENFDDDSEGDTCDLDDDNDQVEDSLDNCPLFVNPAQADADFDNVGDLCDDEFNDLDLDTVPDAIDNCPMLTNIDQVDTDEDMRGNVCDSDDDNDFINDDSDNCPLIENPNQADTDMDGIGDACDTLFNDIDKDLIADAIDNCPSVFNPDQLNSDTDPEGDLCDSDDDNDNVIDELDNCVLSPNPDQEDLDEDQEGDVCDNDIDGDTVMNGADSEAFDKFLCSDQDEDLCDDCSSGTFSLIADGIDTDQNGVCDISDPDNDGDGVPDDADKCPLLVNELHAAQCLDQDFCFPILVGKSNGVLVCL